MRRSPRRILESACSVTRKLTRTSSIAVSGLRGAAIPALDDAEDLSPSDLFTLLAAVDVRELCRPEDDEEEVEVDVEEVERVMVEEEAVGADWGM